MGAVYVSMRSHWATYADGRPLRGKHADFTAIDARIDELDIDTLQRVSDADTGESLAEISAYEDLENCTPDQLDDEEFLIEVGATALRRQLKAAVRTLAEETDEANFDFDGRRWFVSSGGYTHGDPPTDAYRDIGMLDLTDVMVAPLDGPKFVDVPVMAATVAVLDDIAATVRDALKAANLPADALAAVEEHLEGARTNVADAADTFRTVLDKVNVQRCDAAWKLCDEQMEQNS